MPNKRMKTLTKNMGRVYMKLIKLYDLLAST